MTGLDVVALSHSNFKLVGESCVTIGFEGGANTSLPFSCPKKSKAASTDVNDRYPRRVFKSMDRFCAFKSVNSMIQVFASEPGKTVTNEGKIKSFIRTGFVVASILEPVCVGTHPIRPVTPATEAIKIRF
jgi:hypothetical protein